MTREKWGTGWTAAQERWGKRERKRQLAGAWFERTVLAPPKLAPVVRVLHLAADTIFKDTDMLGFLDLPPLHQEADLQHARGGKSVRIRANWVFREGAENRTRGRVRSPFRLAVSMQLKTGGEPQRHDEHREKPGTASAPRSRQSVSQSRPAISCSSLCSSCLCGPSESARLNSFGFAVRVKWTGAAPSGFGGQRVAAAAGPGGGA